MLEVIDGDARRAVPGLILKRLQVNFADLLSKQIAERMAIETVRLHVEPVVTDRHEVTSRMLRVIGALRGDRRRRSQHQRHRGERRPHRCLKAH